MRGLPRRKVEMQELRKRRWWGWSLCRILGGRSEDLISRVLSECLVSLKGVASHSEGNPLGFGKRGAPRPDLFKGERSSADGEVEEEDDLFFTNHRTSGRILSSLPSSSSTLGIL